MDQLYQQAHYDLPSEIKQLEIDLDNLWMALTGAVVIIMQLGIAYIEGGSVRYRNMQHIMIIVFVNASLSIIIMYAWGYGFMVGETNDSQFNGTSEYIAFTFRSKTSHYAEFGINPVICIFQVFDAAMTSAANNIVSGGAAERMSYIGFMIITFFFSGLIQPITIHWAYSGWLYDLGYHDFAASGALHLVAGLGAFILTYSIGPRKHRFNPKYEESFKPSQPTYICLSTLILYMSWLCFNSGSTLALSGNAIYVTGTSIGNTMIGGASGALTVFFYNYFRNRNSSNRFSLVLLCNGNLAGLVCVSGSNDDIENWAAFVIGIIGGLTYLTVGRIVEWLKIDDPCDAIPIHFGCGFMGAMMPGWFVRSSGIFYSHGARQWGIQLLGMVCFMGWSGFWHLCAIVIAHKLGLLRMDEKILDQGIDKMMSGGGAYYFDNNRINQHQIQQSEL